MPDPEIVQEAEDTDGEVPDLSESDSESSESDGEAPPPQVCLRLGAAPLSSARSGPS
jgi:hypothetical protein